MKAEFNKVSDYEKAAAKARLYAKYTMVVTISMKEVTHDGKTIGVDDIREGFLTYMKENNIPHALIQAENESVTYATCPEKGKGEPNARAAVAGYFKGELEDALAMQAYFQQRTHGPVSDKSNDKDQKKVISMRDRIEVVRNVIRLRMAA